MKEANVYFTFSAKSPSCARETSRGRMWKYILGGILAPLVSFAQMQDYSWYFGCGAGLSFKTSPPTPLLNGSFCGSEACASISDDTGRILFYSDGDKLFNIYGDTLANGNGLPTYLSNFGSTNTNGVLILPVPDSDSLFYVFSQNSYVADSGLWYNVVNPYHNALQGKLLTPKNRRLLQRYTSEKLAAVKHANGRDWWVLCHGGFGNFFEFLIRPDSILGPFEYNIGSSDITGNGQIAEMFFSQNGSKLFKLSYAGSIDKYDFDRCSGFISGYRQYGDTGWALSHRMYYGGSCSPNGNLIYVSTLNLYMQFDSLWQINISNEAAAVWTLVWANPFQNLVIGQHQLGPDNKIYISIGTETGDTMPKTHLKKISYITNPDSVGLGCGFQFEALNLNGGLMFLSLPNSPSYNLGALPGSPCDTLGLGEPHIENSLRGVSLFPNPNSGRFTLGYFLPQGSSGKLEVYNLLGEKVYEQELKKNSREVQINLALAKGIYLCRVVSSNQSQSIKFMIE